MAEITSNLKLLNLQGSNVEQTHVELTANTAINPQTHSNRELLVADAVGDLKFTLDDPERAGIHYRFKYGGTAANAQNVLIKTQTATNNFSGSIIHTSTDTDVSTAVRADADTHDTLTITAPGNFDINCLSNGTATWHVWGSTAGSGTDPAFSSS